MSKTSLNCPEIGVNIVEQLCQREEEKSRFPLARGRGRVSCRFRPAAGPALQSWLRSCEQCPRLDKVSLCRGLTAAQHDLRTPTGRCGELFSIGSIRGSGGRFSFTARRREPMAFSAARWTARIKRGRWRFRSGCSIGPHACPRCASGATRSSIWRRWVRCRRCSTRR